MHRVLNKYTKIIYLIFAVFCLVCMSGCAGKDSDNDTKIILTTGFNDDEIFKISDEVCTRSQIMVYVTDLQRQYEKVYGPKIWDTKVDGVTLEKNIKDVALARISQVKTVKLMAIERGMQLSDEETQKIKAVAETYYSSLGDDADRMGITFDTIYGLYEDYALSQKLYENIVKDVNPEISDDEARTITVGHILIKTYNYDDDGTLIPYDSIHKEEARALAASLRKRIMDGEDFEALAKEYSAEEETTISFGKGEMQPAFEMAAFDLSSGEVSDVIETDRGYSIIKCISTFNKEVTDENKLKIVQLRKQEAFNGEYEEFASALTKKLNDQAWEAITLPDEINPDAGDFFSVFKEGF